MPVIHFTATTTATPEQFIAAVTDFGPGRSKTLGNTDDSQLVVHDSGPDWADVTERKGPMWERLRYDWSDPDRIRMTTTDPTSGAAPPGTPTRSSAGPTARPELTSSPCAKART